jgi:Tol biopolymer transport system component
LRFSISESHGANVLAEISADGGHQRRLFPQWTELHASGTWTPDGEYFLFQRVQQNHVNLWVLREKDDFLKKVNRAPVQLTSGPLDFLDPQPSTDGKKIYAVGIQPRSELVRYDGKSKQFVPFLSGISVGQLSFSSDGQWVAYTTAPEGTLWRSRIDGTQKLQLTSAPMFALMPRWSPDGRQIAFAESQLLNPRHLYVVPADGGTARLFPVNDHIVVRPTWTGDGSSIVFGDNDSEGSNIIKMVNLTTMKPTVLPDSRDVIFPVASPHGRYVAGTSLDSQKLLLFDIGAQKWSELLKMNVGFTEWSKDGEYIYFDTGPSASPAVYRIRVADRKLERVADLKGLRRTIFALIPWSGLTPDDSPLLLRDVSSQEVYALDFEAP